MPTDYDTSSPEGYEVCARCGYDHEYEPVEAQKAHQDCSLCQAEVKSDKVGEGPDHSCRDHHSAG